MNVFEEAAFPLVVGVEGGFTDDPEDHGNWTSGICGQGQCKGTKYGLSAAAWYGKVPSGQWPPTMDDAHSIYRTKYWDALRGDSLPPSAAIVLFDYSVNSGLGSGAEGRIADLQRAAGVVPDGVTGPVTMAAVARMGGPKLAAKITAARILHLASLPTWGRYGKGWATRMATILAASIEHETAAPGGTGSTAPVSQLEAVKQAMREVLDERKAA